MKNDIQVTITLDTSGKCCPMPMVEANKAIRKLAEGDVIQIIATDPGTLSDIPSWCERTGNELISYNEQNSTYEYYVRKS